MLRWLCFRHQFQNVKSDFFEKFSSKECNDGVEMDFDSIFEKDKIVYSALVEGTFNKVGVNFFFSSLWLRDHVSLICFVAREIWLVNHKGKRGKTKMILKSIHTGRADDSTKIEEIQNEIQVYSIS